MIARNQVRNTSAAASRWLRDSSVFRPANSTSSMTPGVRPKMARYSSQMPSTPAATIASSSTVGGIRPGRAMARARQPISASVSTTSHTGARSACGASTMARPAASSAKLRAPSARWSGAAQRSGRGRLRLGAHRVIRRPGTAPALPGRRCGARRRAPARARSRAGAARSARRCARRRAPSPRGATGAPPGRATAGRSLSIEPQLGDRFAGKLLGQHVSLRVGSLRATDFQATWRGESVGW